MASGFSFFVKRKKLHISWENKWAVSGRVRAELSKMGVEINGQSLTAEKKTAYDVVSILGVGSDDLPPTITQFILDSFPSYEKKSVLKNLPPAKWFKKKPMKHQRYGIGYGLEKSFAFHFDTGTGKTGTVLNVLRRLGEKEGRFRVLVLIPNNLWKTWEDEKKIHIPASCPFRIIRLQYTQMEKRTEALSNGWHDETFQGTTLFTINYESFRTEAFYDFVKKAAFDAIIFDESHRVMTPTSKTSKRGFVLAQKAKYVFLLTGTPLNGRLMSLYSQMRMINPMIFGVGNPWAFRAKYCIEEIRPGGWKELVGYKNTDKIREELTQYSMRVDKNSCLDLPPLVKRVVPVKLSVKHRKLYDEMKEKGILELEGLEDGKLIAQNVLALETRLAQIAGGFVGGVAIDKENKKIKALVDEAQTLRQTGPVLIWARFTAEIDAIRDAFDGLAKEGAEKDYWTTGVYDGRTKAKERDDLERRFQAGELDALILQAQAGGVGLNFSIAHASLIYSKSPSYLEYCQLTGRNYRKGSERWKRVLQLDFLAEKTIDEKNHAIIEDKDEFSRRMLDWRSLFEEEKK